jgi:hypothetical protein
VDKPRLDRRLGPAGLTPGQAQAGIAEMSQKFRELGGQVYVDADKAKAANKALE